jgi:hypothetical protein
MNLPATFQPTASPESRPQPHPSVPLRPQLEVTVREARDALVRMGAESPEHAHLAAAIDALLVRLDTVRDESLMRAQFAAGQLRNGNVIGAQRSVANIALVCGRRDDRHALTLQASTNGRPL